MSGTEPALEIKIRKVGFLLPIINGKIYLGQRGTEPFKGYYGAIGGKAEPASERAIHNQPQVIYKPGNHPDISLTDRLAQEEGRELISETSIREFCEEIFSELKFPEEFRKEDITDVYKLGFITDIVPNIPGVENDCYFHIAHVNRTDFSLSPREVTDFRELSKIDPRKIFPLTRITLNHLQYAMNPSKGVMFDGLIPYEKDELHKQIKRWKNPERKFTAMMWAYTDTKASSYNKNNKF